MTISSEEIGRLSQAFKSPFNKCLEPRLACKNTTIRAHSIQNGRVLDLIATNGHVMMLRQIFSKDRVDIEFKSVGRNLASTFTGLCNEHDTTLFAPIDTRLFDREDREQLFLLAYRSVCRELHTEIEQIAKFQSAYKSSVELGIDSADDTNPAGQMACMFMNMARQTYLYRADNFDLPLLEANFDTIKHDIIEITHPTPILAVSALFSLDKIRNEDDFVRVVLNVFPVDRNRSFAVFSYTGPDQNKARAALDRVLTSAGTDQKYELSRLILSRIENFLISPAHFDTWSVEKVSRIRDAFLNNEEVPEHHDMMLF
jgi:hypothetical protein